MSQPQENTAGGSAYRTPRWVKIVAGVVIVAVVLIAALMLAGHNPMQHLQDLHGAPPAGTAGPQP